MLMLLAVFGYASADAATYYAKAIAKVSSSGGGKVFVNTTNSSANAVWAESSEATKTGTSSYSNITFYLFAQADEGYEFDHWATADNSTSSASKNSPWSYGFKSTSQNSASPTTNTRYAVFKKKQPYYSALTAYANEGGKVFASITDTDTKEWAATSSVNQTTEATAAPSHSYYIYAQGNDGWDFIGWANTADGTVVSKNNPYNAKVTANSTDSEAPTAANYYAKFAQAVNHYSQATAKTAEGGLVFVSNVNSTEGAEWASTSTAKTTTQNAEVPTHTYYYYAQAQDGYEFKGWMKEGSETVVSTENPYTATVNAESVDAENPTTIIYVPKFVTAVPHYSKLTVKLNGQNDFANAGVTMIGGKVYVGKSANDTPEFAYSSECTQMTYSVDAASHDYYLYAEPEEGFEFAGWTQTASATTSFNSTSNPFKPSTAISATSTDPENPTEGKTWYAAFKYKADNKPTTGYTNFTVKCMVENFDADGKKIYVPSDDAGMTGVTFGENATSCIWHNGSSTSETHSAEVTTATVNFPYTIFAKANLGYEFLGFASTATSTSPGNKDKGETGYYSNSYTKMSVSVANLSWPGSAGLENAPKNKTYYAFFKKLEQMEEPTGTTSVEVTEVTGTTELVEGSVSKDFTVDIVLNENVPYDKPGSDKNAKPSEVLKQFVTVLGANGNKSSVANYSLVYESKDLGEDGNGMSLGTAYTAHTLRFAFPYNIKADTYTVHLPYGLYTTVNGNKTPTYEFTINVTADVNPYLTIKSQFPTEGLTMKYKAASQTSEPDASKGEFDKSNITAAIEFNEVVESIDESKKDGIVLTNTTNGVNYKALSVIRNAALFGKVSGEVSIAYPELVNGSYTLTIPAGLFVGSTKTNEEITIHFTVTGFNNVQLKPYEMITDEISPKANAMTEKIEKLQDIAISYKGEFGKAQALVGNASGIKVQRYTEVISGEGEGAKPVRTYYDVESTPSVRVNSEGRLIVSFKPALYTGMYEVTVPAGMAANMDAAGMTMAEKVNAGYAETPAYSMTFNVESIHWASATMSVNADAKWGTFMAPFIIDIPKGVTAYEVEEANDNTLVLHNGADEDFDYIPAYCPVLLYAENGFKKTFEDIEMIPGKKTNTWGLLTGTLEPIASVEQGNYLLQNQDGKVGFYKVNKDGLKLGANRCYLTKSAGSAGVKAFYLDEETAIKALESLTSGKAEIYDLNGRKLSKMQKGVNIVNGVKVLVK